jgi:hypothetical protein
MGHILSSGSIIRSKLYSFKSSPYPGQDSLQRVIIFGDMGKVLFCIDLEKFITKKKKKKKINLHLFGRRNSMLPNYTPSTGYP